MKSIGWGTRAAVPFTGFFVIGFVLVIVPCLEGAPSGFPVTDGLVVFMDAEAVEVDEGGRVLRMLDRSGWENHAEAELNAAPMLVRKATPAGRDAARFDGITQHLAIASNPAAFDGRGKTTLAVFRASQLGLRRMVNLGYATMDAGNPSASGRASTHSVYTHASGAVRVENRTATGSSVAVSTPSGTIGPGGFFLGGNLWKENGDTIAIVRDEENQRGTGTATGANANPAGHTVTRIGAGGGVLPSDFFAGDLAAVVIFNRALSETELLAVEGYLYETYLRRRDPRDEYAAWAVSLGFDGDEADPGADPDGDGITNLEAFTFGIDPRNVDRSRLPRMEFRSADGDRRPVFTLNRHWSTDTIVSVSPDLLEWHSRPSDLILVESTVETLTVAPSARGWGGSRFLRVSVSLDGGPAWIELGRRAFGTILATGTAPSSVSPGTPVVPMWEAPYADASKPAGGFPLAAEAQHREVWKPQTREDGAFNHHAALTYADGRFLAMWSNHPLGEDASGQRVLFSEAASGAFWSEPRELFRAPDEIRDRGEPGVSLRPDRWVTVDGRCFAVVYARTQGMSNSSLPIAREIDEDGALGEPFSLRPEGRTGVLPVYMRGGNPYWNPADAERIRQWYVTNEVVSWWAQSGEGVPGSAVDGANMIEPLTYRAADGEPVLLLRFHPSGGLRHNNRMYVSFRDANGAWAPPYPTDIPDSPSRTEAIALPDGTVLLIGNHMAPELDAGSYLFRDPLTVAVSSDGYRFDRVYALRAGAPAGYRFDGIGGRTGGFAYSSSLVRDGWLYTLYSVGKEDIAITRVPLHSFGF